MIVLHIVLHMIVLHIVLHIVLFCCAAATTVVSRVSCVPDA